MKYNNITRAVFINRPNMVTEYVGIYKELFDKSP